jgi:hypothetical protein
LVWFLKVIYMIHTRFTLNTLLKGILLVCLVTVFCMTPATAASPVLSEQNSIRYADDFSVPVLIEVPAGTMLYALHLEGGNDPDAHISPTCSPGYELDLEAGNCHGSGDLTLPACPFGYKLDVSTGECYSVCSVSNDPDNDPTTNTNNSDCNACPSQDTVLMSYSDISTQISSKPETVELVPGRWCFALVADKEISLAELGYTSDNIDGFFPTLIKMKEGKEGEEEDPWEPHPYSQDPTGFCPDGTKLLDGLCYPVAGAAPPRCILPWIDNPDGSGGCINTDPKAALVAMECGSLSPDGKGGCYDPNLSSEPEDCPLPNQVYDSVNKKCYDTTQKIAGLCPISGQTYDPDSKKCFDPKADIAGECPISGQTYDPATKQCFDPTAATPGQCPVSGEVYDSINKKCYDPTAATPGQCPVSGEVYDSINKKCYDPTAATPGQCPVSGEVYDSINKKCYDPTAATPGQCPVSGEVYDSINKKCYDPTADTPGQCPVSGEVYDAINKKCYDPQKKANSVCPTDLKPNSNGSCYDPTATSTPSDCPLNYTKDANGTCYKLSSLTNQDTDECGGVSRSSGPTTPVQGEYNWAYDKAGVLRCMLYSTSNDFTQPIYYLPSNGSCPPKPNTLTGHEILAGGSNSLPYYTIIAPNGKDCYYDRGIDKCPEGQEGKLRSDGAIEYCYTPTFPDCPPGQAPGGAGQKCYPILSPDCPTGYVMINGACQLVGTTECPSGYVMINGVCQLAGTTECPSGYVMVNGACQLVGTTECPPGAVMINGACQLVGTTECPSGYVMVNGACQLVGTTECPNGSVMVNGACQLVGTTE